MAVAVTGTPVTGEGTTTPLTFSVTAPADAQLMSVRVSAYQAQPTGVTFNADTVGSRGTAGPSSGSDYASLWTLTSPDIATGNVVVTFAANREVVARATCYTGVDIADPVGTAVTDVSTGTEGAVSSVVTSATDGLVIDVLAGFNFGTLTVGASQTQDYYENNAGSAESGAGSREAGAASVTMSHSWSDTSRNLAQVALPIKPSVAGGTSILRQMMAHHGG